MAQGEGSGHPRMQESAREAASRAGEAVGQMRDKAREFAADVQGRAEEAWHGTREGLSRAAERTGVFRDDALELIRRYPAASLGAAFVIGCLTGCAWSMMTGGRDKSGMSC